MSEKKEFIATRKGIKYLDLKNPNVGKFDVLLEQNLITVDLPLCRPSGNGDTYSF